MKAKKSPKSAKAATLPWTQAWIDPIILSVLCLVAYQPIFSNQLIDWDDLKYITESPITRDFSLTKAFTTPVMGNYHPLTMISLAINFKLSGDSAFAYHFTNLLFHILNSILVLKVASQLGLNKAGSRVAALVFALHPLHVESVAWAAERKDVLYTCFALLSWLFYIRFKLTDCSNKSYLVYSLVLFIGACLSKGMAVTLPVLLVASDLLMSGRKDWKKIVLWLSPYIILSIVFGSIAIWAQDLQGGMTVKHDLDFLSRITLALRGYWFYLQQTLLPLGLSAIYPYPASLPELPTIWFIQAGIALLLISATLVLSKKHPKILFIWLGYSGVIFPVLQLLPVGDAVAADRYFYLASVPVFLGFGMLYEHLEERWGKQIQLPSMILIPVLMGLTWYQSSLWKDEVTLFSHTIKHYPESAVAWNNIGAMLQRKQQFAEAIPYYEKAIEIRKDYTIALCNLGISYGRTGQLDKAISLLEKSIESDSAHAESYGNLGNAYIMTGKREEALQLFLTAVRLNPRYVEAWYNLGIYYRENKDPQQAVKYFKKSVEIRNQFPEGWWSLSAVLFEIGDQQGAIEAARTSSKQGNDAATQWLQANKLK
jgi:tetratricopeptide (TPR) repeat protein